MTTGGSSETTVPGSGRTTGSLLWDGSLRLLVFSIFLVYAVRSLADPDLWGHVLFGQRMLSLGHVTRVDPYSFLSDSAWINHEWLSEVVFASAWELGGAPGLVLLKAALLLATLSAVYLHLRRRGLDVIRAGAPAGLLLLALLTGARAIRPQVFTFLLFTLTLLVLVRAEEGKPRAAWLLPPMVALWVNLHGGVLAGLGTIGLWAVGHGALVLHRERRLAAVFAGDRKHVWGAVLASGLALLVNPYGPELPLFLLETGTVDRPFIVEWQALDLTSAAGGIYLLFLGIAGGSFLRSSRPIRPAAAILLPVMALLPFTAIRLLPLFGISVIVLASPQIADLLGRWTSEPRRSTRPVVRTAIAGLLVIVSGSFLSRVPEDLRCIPVGEDYPVEAVSLLEGSSAEGRLAVFFNWGEYAIWHLRDQFRVSMDGRRETVYPDTIYRGHLDFIRGTGDWDSVLESHPVNVALVPASSAADNLLGLKPGWQAAYRDSVAAVHVREETREAELVSGASVTRWHPRRAPERRGAASEARLCFP